MPRITITYERTDPVRGDLEGARHHGFETLRRKCLLERIENWRHAREIREFVSLVAGELQARRYQEEDERRVSEWISGARAAADALDPLQSGLILDPYPERR